MLLVPLGLMDTLATLGNTILTPFYWIISGMMVLFHKLLSPLLGADSGVTWVVVLVLMTCVLRGAMLPLYMKQMNGARAMTSIQPAMKALKDKYPNDRERQSREMMKLYQENGVSPYASCLPILAQTPIFMALFWVISSAARHDPSNPASSALKGYWLNQYPDVAQSLRNSTVFGAKLSGTFLPASPFGGQQALALVLIVVMVSVLLVQQLHMMRRNMPPQSLEGAMGQQQKMMLYIFPFFYAIGGISVPIGVLIYWVISNLWTFCQQFWIIRHYPTPDTPAYIEWEDRMLAQGKDPKAIEAARIEAGRSKKQSAMAKAMAAAAEKQAAAQAEAQAEIDKQRSAKAAAASQAVVRTDTATGRQVVVRTQPRNQSRARRKK